MPVLHRFTHPHLLLLDIEVLAQLFRAAWCSNPELHILLVLRRQGQDKLPHPPLAAAEAASTWTPVLGTGPVPPVADIKPNRALQRSGTGIPGVQASFGLLRISYLTTIWLLQYASAIPLLISDLLRLLCSFTFRRFRVSFRVDSLLGSHIPCIASYLDLALDSACIVSLLCDCSLTILYVPIILHLGATST